MNMKITSMLLALALLAACAPTTPIEEPRACCMAMTASCLACADGVTEEQYCLVHPDAIGCEAPEEVLSCAAIQCLTGSDCVEGVGCVPREEVKPCNLACIQGTHCVTDSEGPRCTPDEPQAKIRGDACTMEYNPVCGENGITYGNPCMATTEGMSYTMGECSGTATAQESEFVDCTDPRPGAAGCVGVYNPTCVEYKNGTRETKDTCNPCRDPNVIRQATGECA